MLSGGIPVWNALLLTSGQGAGAGVGARLEADLGERIAGERASAVARPIAEAQRYLGVAAGRWRWMVKTPSGTPASAGPASSRARAVRSHRRWAFRNARRYRQVVV